MGDGEATAAAPSSAGGRGPRGPAGPLEVVKKIREQLRETARQRDALVEQQRNGITKIQDLFRVLNEVATGGLAETSDSTEGGQAASLKEELERLQSEVSRQLEVELAAMEGLNARESGETHVAVDGKAEVAAAAGKRKRGEREEREEADAASSTKEASESTPLQPADLKFGRGVLSLEGDASVARGAAAAFRIASRFTMLTGEVVPDNTLEEAFEAYTGGELDETSRQALLDAFMRLDIPQPGHSDDSKLASKPRDHQTGQWLPGLQYLEAPSLSTAPTTVPTDPDTDVTAIRTYIESEKRVLADLDASVLDTGAHDGNAETARALFLQAGFMSTIGRGDSSTDMHAFVADRLDRRSKQQRKVTTYQTFREFGGVFIQKEDDIRRLVGQDRQLNGGSAQYTGATRFGGGAEASSSGYDKPFSLGEDSITRQLGRGNEAIGGHHNTVKRRRRADPMKMLCPFELNGICNDANCSYLHTRDFDGEDSDSGDKRSSDTSRKAVLSTEGRGFLANFTEMRKKYLAKWPVITPSTLADMTAAEEARAQAKIAAQPGPATERAVEGEQVPADTPGGQHDDYLPLNDPDDMATEHLDAGVSARYYAGTNQQLLTTPDLERLQQRVEENPEDSAAWLQLAIRQLNLDIPLSDDLAQPPSGLRFHLELSTLSALLYHKARGSQKATLLDERNVRKCLHVLSRALEVEANLYVEAVWLLYLHMCWQISDRQLEEEAVSKATQFVVSSHRLWLRYLSVVRLAKVDKAVAFHGRLLQMLCQISSDRGDQDSSSTDKDAAASQSTAVSAVALHLCVTLAQGGATELLHQFLDAVVYGSEGDRVIPQIFSWCSTVRERLSRHDMVALHLIYGHTIVYDHLPPCAEDWLASAGCDGIKMTRFAYTIESFRSEFNAVHDGNFPIERRAKLLDVYRHAYECITAAKEEEAALASAGGDAVLNNWMILMAELYLDEGDASTLAGFFTDKLAAIQAHPAAAFTASKLLLSHLMDSDRAQQLMMDVLAKSEGRTFPKALHFYLFASDFLPDLTAALDIDLIQVVGQLSTILGADVNAAEAAIQGMEPGGEPMLVMMRALLAQLLSLWMDQLTDKPSDIYVGLDLCHLMARLRQPFMAIAGLDRILHSSRFSTLDVGSRQLTWSLRFLLQINQLEEEAKQAAPSTTGSLPIQHELSQLFKRYMSKMSDSNELARQLELRIGPDTDVDVAVIECLYPRQHQSLTADVSLELFQLCCVTIPDRDKPQFFSLYANELATEPRFALAFADVAGRGWEWRAAHAALKQALVVHSSTLWHADVVRAAVAGEIKRRRMKAASTLLATELASHPASLATWQLVLALEVLLGDASPSRGEAVARQLALQGLPLTCNSFGDAAMLGAGVELPSAPHSKQEQLSWNSLRLLVVPRSILLHSELVSLNLSGNQLVELPSDLDRLQRLEALDVSENALMALPDALSRLPSLVSLNVAHNNLSSLPIGTWGSLRKLTAVDCSHNLLVTMSAPEVMAVRGLKELKLDGNAIPEDQVRAVGLVLERRRLGIQSTSSSSIDLTIGEEADARIDLTNSDDADEITIVDTDTEGDEAKQAETPRTTGGGLSIIDLANDLGVTEPNDALDGESDHRQAIRRYTQAELPVTAGVVALHKLTEFMAANGLASRADVRAANPALWTEFVGANVGIHSSLGACLLCEAENADGQHQRLNAVTLCLDCIEDVTARLRSTRRRALEADGESKSHE